MWDYGIQSATGDMTGKFVAGQDEILQRIETRLRRHLGEWFCNTAVGMPWLAGPSDIIPAELSKTTAILGSRDIASASLLVRTEIAETAGVVRIVAFNADFDGANRVLRIRASIATEYGTAFLKYDHTV